jgi:CRP-like cAMP-binding protein
MSRPIMPPGLPYDLLPAPIYRRIAAEAVELKVKKGEILFAEGAPSHFAFTVLAGRVHLQHLRPDGRVFAVCLHAPGDTFCCLPILDRRPYPVTAIAVSSSTVLRVSAALFRECLTSYPRFGQTVLERFSLSLRDVACQECGSDAGARLATKILGLLEKFDDGLPLTRRELGELAGVTVETAIREIKIFERSGWVATSRGHLRVLDVEALQRRANGNGTNGKGSCGPTV